MALKPSCCLIKSIIVSYMKLCVRSQETLFRVNETFSVRKKLHSPSFPTQCLKLRLLYTEQQNCIIRKNIGNRSVSILIAYFPHIFCRNISSLITEWLCVFCIAKYHLYQLNTAAQRICPIHGRRTACIYYVPPFQFHESYFFSMKDNIHMPSTIEVYFAHFSNMFAVSTFPYAILRGF